MDKYSFWKRDIIIDKMVRISFYKVMEVVFLFKS